MRISDTALVAMATVSWAVAIGCGGYLLSRTGAGPTVLAALGRLGHRRRPAAGRGDRRGALLAAHIVLAALALVLWVAGAFVPGPVPTVLAAVLLVCVMVFGICSIDRWRDPSGRHARRCQLAARGFPVLPATFHLIAATATLVLVALAAFERAG